MTTATATFRETRTGGAGGFLFVLLVIVAGVIVGLSWFQGEREAEYEAINIAVDQQTFRTDYDHGLARHGNVALRADDCFRNYGNVQTWWNELNGHYIQVCVDPYTNEIFLRVLARIKGEIQRITRYRKDGVTNLDDLGKILRDQGAELRWVLK